MSNLTIKQERFVLEYMKDGNASRAYREAYDSDNMKSETINRKAKELTDHPKISAKIAEFRQMNIEQTIISIEKRKELLTKFAFEEDPSNAMKAVEILNKMDGVYVTKNETTVTGSVNYYIPEQNEDL